MWLVALPLLGAQFSAQPDSFTLLDYLAIPIWFIGFGFEAIGDWQLLQFKANPQNAGKVMDSGLWHYTRHPNYFGDAVQWWAFFLIAASAGAWWTVISPLLMTFLLMRVSGVTMLEHTLKKTKPEYRDYIMRTSAFFPMPPKR
jgi:steroid 5-alpha reductase family enzyme